MLNRTLQRFRTDMNRPIDKTKVPDLNPDDYLSIVFFTGAGMSAECGIPTYRGAGGVWREYNWEEYASQRAFELNQEKVLNFHQLRRASVLECTPHKGHEIITKIQEKYANLSVVTQNIDGMHQQAGTVKVVELHGSLWRLRCKNHGLIEDVSARYKTMKCPDCSEWLRPDIVWFEDFLDETVVEEAKSLIAGSKLFLSIGTSGVVYPAAGFPLIACDRGATTVYINTELPDHDYIYDFIVQGKASFVLDKMFSKYV